MGRPMYPPPPHRITQQRPGHCPRAGRDCPSSGPPCRAQGIPPSPSVDGATGGPTRPVLPLQRTEGSDASFSGHVTGRNGCRHHETPDMGIVCRFLLKPNHIFQLAEKHAAHCTDLMVIIG